MPVNRRPVSTSHNEPPVRTPAGRRHRSAWDAFSHDLTGRRLAHPTTRSACLGAMGAGPGHRCPAGGARIAARRHAAAGRPTDACHPRVRGRGVDHRSSLLRGQRDHHHLADGLPDRHGADGGRPREALRHLGRDHDGAHGFFQRGAGAGGRRAVPRGRDDAHRARPPHRALHAVARRHQHAPHPAGRHCRDGAAEPGGAERHGPAAPAWCRS